MILFFKELLTLVLTGIFQFKINYSNMNISNQELINILLKEISSYDTGFVQG